MVYFLPLLQTRCCRKMVCSRCDIFSSILDGDIGLSLSYIYKHNVTNNSFGYKGVRADRVYLELLSYHRLVKRGGDEDGVITPAHIFWFEEVPSYRGYFCRMPLPGDEDFQDNLKITQDVLLNYVNLAPHGNMRTRCCGEGYVIGGKAPLIGHNNISDRQQCYYLANRIIGSLVKLTNWTGQYELGGHVDAWVEWALPRYYPSDEELVDMCGICYEADTVYELCGADQETCHHTYCANCLTKCLERSYCCAFCRQVPVEIKVASYAYGWEPCEVEAPGPEHDLEAYLMDSSDEDDDDDDDDDDDNPMIVIDDDETDLTYVPPDIDDDSISIDDSSDDELPTIHAPNNRARARRQRRLRDTIRAEVEGTIMEDGVRNEAVGRTPYSFGTDLAVSGTNTHSRRILAHHPHYRLSRSWPQTLRTWYATRYEYISNMDRAVNNGSATCMTCLRMSQQPLYGPACCNRPVCEQCIDILAFATDAKSRISGRTILLPRCPCCGFSGNDLSLQHALSIVRPEQAGYHHRRIYWRRRLEITQNAGHRRMWEAPVMAYLQSR